MCISKGQSVAILTANNDVFYAEKDVLLEVVLVNVVCMTVDDKGACNAGMNDDTTHTGNDRLDWFVNRR